MKNTINTIIKEHPATDWDIYRGDHFHTDSCEWVDPESIDRDAEMELDWEVMDQDEYNRTILANADEIADFAETYGDADATVLCILIKE